MSDKYTYDELKDIEKAQKGDVGARLRVEILIPFSNILKQEIDKIPKPVDESDAAIRAYENKRDAIEEAVDSTICSMLIMVMGSSNFSYEDIRAMSGVYCSKLSGQIQRMISAVNCLQILNQIDQHLKNRNKK